MTTQTDPTAAAIEELTLSVRVIESNYITKEELAILSGRIDVLSGRVGAMPAQIELALRQYIDLRLEQEFKAHTEMMYRTFATKEDLANAVYLLTWRMAAFGSVLLSAGFAFASYL